MKFILFVEGDTEKKSVREFIKRWIDPKLNRPVGIDVVKFEGWPELVKDSPKKAELYLNNNDVIAVVALLDLHGPTFYPPSRQSVSDRYSWAKANLEGKVQNPKFFQFFAVHEVEAWLLSDPGIFPDYYFSSSDERRIEHPETVNFNEPPGKFLNRIYRSRTGQNYKKVSQGQQLFKKLDPLVAYDKCPYLKELLDKMLEKAKQSGF
jgi:hypothetical protein